MECNDSIQIEAQMLIHKPVNQVFEAIVNPDITTKFWFTKSSGRLALGEKIRWDWEMFGVGDTLLVREFEPNRRILIEWENDPTKVLWHFETKSEHSTLVKITNWGFSKNPEEALPMAVDSKGGYTMVLAGLKAYLEHNIELNLVRDQFPDGCPT